MRKKRIGKKSESVMLVFLCVILLSGCYSKKGIIMQQQRTNERLPQIRYKSSISAAYGQMAAMYDGDLYYYSVKNSGTGIYKRIKGTEKEELIVEVENIRKLQITAEGIYYIGRTPERDFKQKDSVGRWNTYGFFYHEGHGKTESADELMAEDCFAWDFYVDEDEIFFVTVRYPIPTGNPDLLKKLLKKDGTVILWDSIDKKKNIATENEEKILTVTENFGIWSEFELKSEQSDEDAYGASHSEIYMVYSKNGAEPVYVASKRIYYEAQYEGGILPECEKGYLCTSGNEVWLVGLGGLQKKAVISAEDKINFGFRENDTVYIIAENSEEKQTIYRLWLDTFRIDKHVGLEKDEKVIGKEGNIFICASPQEIVLRNAEEGKVTGTKKLDNKINWEKDTVEIAGDLLFVYDYQEAITVQEQVKWR